MTGAGFHEGELAVQERAGVRVEAARLRGMLATPNLDGGHGRFLADRDFAVVTATSSDGLLWTSPLSETPGFLEPHSGTLTIHARPRPGDPLREIHVGQPIGLIAVEFATRRRVRVNGTLIRRSDTTLEVDVDQAFGNCPQYIQRRQLARSSEPPPADQIRIAEELTPAQEDLIARSDTFFLGTIHPVRGADSSHRGGTSGFVRVDQHGIWWPDYPGNNMFNSLGNLAVDPRAALTFIDFDTGSTLQVSGTATLEWTPSGTPGDDGGTGRRVRFRATEVAAGAINVHSADVEPSPHNPELS